MRIGAKPEPLRRLLRWTQAVLFTIGVLLLGYCGLILADSWLFQKRGNQELERQRRQARPGEAEAPGPVPSPPAAIGSDGLIGRIEIPSLHVAAVVFEGTGAGTLRHAVGHISGTALPGQAGNIGLAGHRDTFFRPLRDIVRADIITLTTPRGPYRYAVVSTRVVAPTEVSVLEDRGGEILTLVTCFPFHFIGAAPSRFIVRAERVP